MPNTEITFYNSVDLFHPEKSNMYNKFAEEVPGFNLFQYMFQVFSADVSIMDRTNSIKTPISSKIIDCCQLPEYDPAFSLDFAEVCQNRARWLLDHSKNTNRKIVVMYSGGVDSSLVLSSFIMAGTSEELKNNIIVLLTNTSINENPTFYRNQILRKFTLESGFAFQQFSGNPKYIIVSGEGSDQLFGSVAVHRHVLQRGIGIISATPTTDLMIELIDQQVKDQNKSGRIVEIFNRVVNSAPININTVIKYYWWLNFTLKWQNVYMRGVGYSAIKFRSTVKIEDNYFTFFHSPDFQKWVMCNSDQLIGETWASYKWKAKEVIYSVNPDANYRDNKVKFGSLGRIVQGKQLPKCIDSNGVFYDDAYPTDCWNIQNDFI
jgi:hypothetical protein